MSAPTITTRSRRSSYATHAAATSIDAGAIVVNGVTYDLQMPNPNLNDTEIAAVLSFVRNSFGNDGDLTTIAEVQKFREALNPEAAKAPPKTPLAATRSRKKAAPATKPAVYSKR